MADEKLEESDEEGVILLDKSVSADTFIKEKGLAQYSSNRGTTNFKGDEFKKNFQYAQDGQFLNCLAMLNFVIPIMTFGSFKGNISSL